VIPSSGLCRSHWPAINEVLPGRDDRRKGDLRSYEIIEKDVKRTVPILPVTFECPDCRSTWQEEIFFTDGTIVFKKPPCPLCDEDERLARSIAA